MQIRVSALLPVCSLACFFISTVLLPSHSAHATPPNPPGRQREAAAPGESSNALRLNTLGVAYLNQQRPADAQKLFEQALAGRSEIRRRPPQSRHLSPQSAKSRRRPRAAPRPPPSNSPTIPTPGTTSASPTKTRSDITNGVAAFEHVTQLMPDEADAYYFVGYLNSQLAEIRRRHRRLSKRPDAFPVSRFLGIRHRPRLPAQR